MSAIPCPSCGRDLPPQPTRCPHCDVSLTGPDAARLWVVDQQLAALRTERVVLLSALRTQPDLATSAAAGPTVPPAVGPTPSTPLAAPRRPSWTTQQTLLAVGVLLVLVASSLALAIAWFVIGPYGQVLVMAGFTALAAVAALRLSRRRLPSSAEALALVTGGLLLLDVAAARRMGLFALGATDARWYAVVTGALVAVLLGWLHHRDQRVAGFALLSLASASIGWAGLVTLAASTADSAAAFTAMLGAAVFAALHLRLAGRAGLVGRAATGPAAAWTVAALVIAASGGLAAWDGTATSQPTSDGLLCVAVLALLAAACTWTVRAVTAARAERRGSTAAVKSDWRARWYLGDWRAVGAVAVVATLAVPMSVTTLALQGGALGTALLAVLTGVAAIGVLSVRPWGRGWTAAWAEAECAAGVLGLVWVSLLQDAQPALVVTLATTALVALTAAVQRPPWRAAASTIAATAFVAAASVGADLVSTTAVALTLAGAGLSLTAVVLWRRGAPEELGIGAVAAVTAGAALLVAAATPLSTGVLLSTVLTISVEAAAAAVLRAAVRAPAAGVSAAAATWSLWLLGELTSLQLQLALIALGAGAWVSLAVWRRGRPEEGTLAAVGLTVAVVAVGDAIGRDWTHAASGLAAAYGLLAVGYAALPHRRAVVTAAIGALAAAAWVELVAAGVDVLEAYTVPVAGLLLAAGLWSHRELHDSSWLTAGPGLAVGLLPSAVYTAVSDPLPRVALTLLVAATTLWVGAWRRRQALVVVGATAAGLVGLTQLGPIVVHLDKSVVIGVVGVGLLAIGARYEQRRSDARAAVSWLASMS